MPAKRRKDVIDETEVGYYHCYSRCARGAFLCGIDPVTGINYDYRKDWIERRQEFLAGVMAIEVTSFAVMDNHMHATLRNRPDVVAKWSDEEVARRWLMVCPGVRCLNCSPQRAPTQEQIKALVADRKKLSDARERLSSISWFMRLLKEFIARKVNHEENTEGSFWAGRFKCTRLLDSFAILSCTMYVDLNLIRAMVVQTPEESVHTSVYLRIIARRARLAGGPAEALQAAAWLAPVECGAAPPDGPQAAAGKRATDDGFLMMSPESYLQLLDWTGRQSHPEKRGTIPADLAPVLERLQMDGLAWVMNVHGFGRRFSSFAGTRQSLLKHAARKGGRWYRGCGKTAGLDLHRPIR